MRRVIVAGALANKPHNGGEAWVRLSWVLGLRRLGFDVWLVEQVSPEICRNETGDRVQLEDSVNLTWFQSVVDRFGLKDRVALVGPDGGAISGAPPDVLRDAAAGAELLVNISGNLTAQPLLALPRRRAYLDLDPGYTQFWHAAGMLGPALVQHDHLLTVGLGINHRCCRVPTGGLDWRPVPPPVVLEEWPVQNGSPAPRFTTVASWRGGYGRAEHDGRVYGQKAHEFRRFVEMPQESSQTFEVALEIDPADRRDRELLQANGWTLVDPHAVAGDPDAFRRYVQGSRGEFSPAQGIYVETSSGWFSDRTTRYLASGRPAVIQDTALTEQIPRGEGLLSFRTPAEAVAAVKAVTADYAHHARAARELAELCFDSDVVLGTLLEDLLP